MADQYLDNPDAENPFGNESLAERRNAALLAHIAAGNSILTFPRQQRHYDVSAAIDQVLARL